jgi:hypothetical protein
MCLFPVFFMLYFRALPFETRLSLILPPDATAVNLKRSHPLHISPRQAMYCLTGR